MRRLLPVIIFLFWLPAMPASAATCSCAGVPLLSAMDTSSTEPGDLYINLTTENHEISDLVQGSDEITDETGRERSSLSQVMSASYGLADRWALSGLLSYVEHSRSVGSSFLGEQNSSGLGDAVLMVRYSPMLMTPFSRHELSFGLGARLAVGKNDAGGLVQFSEDMQPGAGAPATLAWGSYSYAFDQAGTKVVSTSANYTYNDYENDRNYTFGDETNVALVFSHSLGTKFGYSAGLRYRHTDPDERLGFGVPNTGGEWLDFIPAVRYSFTPEWTVSVSGRLPVSRQLNGALQFSTSYSYAVSITHAL
ncbi:MAG: hypothetical protein PsegKO_27970 [Pseudohongiellaceae bacterium]